MSLTNEALQVRKWAAYPALRKVLEGKDLPDKYYGTSSISDNVFERTNRLLEISLLVKEHETEIINFTTHDSLSKDLDQVKNELIELQKIIIEKVHMIKSIKSNLVN